MIKSKSYKICVFCGSKSGNDGNYLKIAFKVGKKLSEKKYTIIYGGGKTGLMGALAEGVTSNKGNLFSIIPRYFKNKNIFLKNSNKILYTKDFYERKKNMIKHADIFFVLPGGFGTLDELFEVISLNQLDVIKKKVVLLNTNNFWNPLRALIKDLKKNGFLYTKENIIFKTSIAKSIEFIENSFNNK
tara:strand:- start:251 stop:811 length:561 start_codon:yes stop_codon:yes gene_type:complete